jgi:hypothetical protein
VACQGETGGRNHARVAKTVFSEALTGSAGMARSRSPARFVLRALSREGRGPGTHQRGCYWVDQPGSRLNGAGRLGSGRQSPGPAGPERANGVLFGSGVESGFIDAQPRVSKGLSRAVKVLVPEGQTPDLGAA